MLDKRLQMAADMIVRGRRLVDVGTDHAYLPAYMLKNGFSPFAVLADASEKPLRNAALTVEKYGLANETSIVLSDGLKSVGEIRDAEIVLAGMGGTLIARILSASDCVKDPSVHLILQPVTRSEDARLFLIKNGFDIEREAAVSDAGRVYIAISAYYSGALKEYPLWYPWFGEQPALKNPASSKFIEKQLFRLKKRLIALNEGGINPDEAGYLSAVILLFTKEFNI